MVIPRVPHRSPVIVLCWRAQGSPAGRQCISDGYPTSLPRVYHARPMESQWCLYGCVKREVHQVRRLSNVAVGATLQQHASWEGRGRVMWLVLIR